MDLEFNNETGNVRYYLKEPKAIEATLIVGRYLYKTYQIKFSSGVKIMPKQWNNKEKMISSGKSKQEYNSKLSKFRLSIVEAHKNFNEIYQRTPSEHELKTIVKQAIEGSGIKKVNKQKKSFDDIYNDYIDLLHSRNKIAIQLGRKGESVKPTHRSYINNIENAYKDLREFANESNLILDIDTFSEKDSLDFQNWLISNKDLKPSTIRTRLKRIVQIMKWAFEKGYTNNRAFMLDEFKPKVPPTQSISLTEKDIDTLYQHDFSQNTRLEKIRDLFVLACHTSLRFGDITRLQLDHINLDQKSIRLVSQKSSKNDTLKILSFSFYGYTEEILKKYDYDIRQIALSNQKTNQYLKEVFTEIPYFKEKIIKTEILTDSGVKFKQILFIDKIDFHTSRRSFCTNRYCEGWDLLEIWDYTGHTDESTFKTYFKPNSEHERLRKENIKLRNEKIRKLDSNEQELKQLREQMKQILELHKKGELGEFEKAAKIIQLNQNAS